MNIPNALTISRVLILPFFFWAYNAKSLSLAGLILFYAFITDFFDGWLARKLKQESDLGALLDPIADKILVLSLHGFIFFLGKIQLAYVMLLFIRNLSQLSVIPVLSWYLKIPFKVKPKWPAKWATAISFILVPLILFQNNIESFFNLQKHLSSINLSLIGISALLEIYVLVTFIPRYYQIYKVQHDTFE